MATVSRSSSPASHARRRPESLIEEARRGSDDCLAQLLETYRNYLRLLAKSQLDDKLRARISASDLVQETLLGAYRDFKCFRGGNERQLLAWLRKILVNRLHVFVQEHVLAQKRDVRREISMHIDTGVSSNLPLHSVIPVQNAPPPSRSVIQRESAEQLREHLDKMSAEHRQVLELRVLQGLPFAKVAAQMNRSTGAVRMLWMRAIKRLRQSLAEENSE